MVAIRFDRDARAIYRPGRVRITYVVHQFLPNYFTGTEQYCFAIARAMQERGHEVEVLALEPDFAEHPDFFAETDEVVEGLKVHRLRTWMLLDRDFSRMEWSHPLITEAVRRRFLDRRPDLVHVFHLRYLGAPILDVCAAQQIPVCAHLMDFWFVCPVVTLRKPDGTLCGGPPDRGLGCMDCVRPGLSEELRWDRTETERRALAELWPADAIPRTDPTGRALDLVQRPKRLRESLLAAASRIWAPSEFLRRKFTDNGWPADRIEVLRYGVDPARIGESRALHRSLPHPSDELRCVFLGSLAEHKGTHVAVDAVLAAGPKVRLRLHGRESDFPDYSRQLREKVGDDPRVEFVGPFEHDQLERVLADADLLIAPSLWYENTPFVVLEAQMAGVPVAVSDLGGLAEIVRDGVDGIVFAAGDSRALANELRALAEQPERRLRLRESAPAVKKLVDNLDEIERAYLEVAPLD